MKLVHLSDIHVWRWPWRPWEIAGKRAVALASLLLGRARRFPRARLAQVVDRAVSLEPDHVLISGDLTTSALRAEFEEVRGALEPILRRSGGTSIVPGNHDRYTGASQRERLFEEYFGEFAPSESFPWLRRLDDETDILALDASRPHLTAMGRFPEAQIDQARRIVAGRGNGRLVILCHYPLRAPALYAGELRRKRAVNAESVASWLRSIGPHLFCCGHVHAAWTLIPSDIPNQLCINAGAPLLVGHDATRLSGFQEIVLAGADVAVTHHGWDGANWQTQRREWSGFFARSSARLLPG
jgi:3',5'-cyclic AMP phosphodiesterase CpdA